MKDKNQEIINQLEKHIQNANETGDKYDFIDPAFEICDELDKLDSKYDIIEPILELIERSPNIDFGGPGPLGSFMETYYKNGYEELLIKSIKRKPTEYTLLLLHRIINDKQNPNHKIYIDLMKTISENTEYTDDIIQSAKNSLTFFC